MYTGIDLVKVERWERLLTKFPERGGKIFTEEEIAHCEAKKAHKWESYAALWAVREAGTFAKRAAELGVTETAVSISHEAGMAAAVVVMQGGRHHDTDNDGGITGA